MSSITLSLEHQQLIHTMLQHCMPLSTPHIMVRWTRSRSVHLDQFYQFQTTPPKWNIQSDPDPDPDRRMNIRFIGVRQLYLRDIFFHMTEGWLSQFSSISTLSISYCNLQTIPTAICQMRQLRQLDISHNAIVSPPSEFADIFPLLTRLNISHNSILPNSFAALLQQNIAIKSLDLSHCILTDVPKKLLARMPLLQSLDLSSNYIHQFVIHSFNQSMPEFPNTLRWLGLKQNPLNAQCRKYLSLYTRINHLRMHYHIIAKHSSSQHRINPFGIRPNKLIIYYDPTGSPSRLLPQQEVDQRIVNSHRPHRRIVREIRQLKSRRNSLHNRIRRRKRNHIIFFLHLLKICTDARAISIQSQLRSYVPERMYHDPLDIVDVPASEGIPAMQFQRGKLIYKRVSAEQQRLLQDMVYRFILICQEHRTFLANRYK